CFFFQAEDGIRDGHVTGVQTCALPILENFHSWGPAFSGHRRVLIPDLPGCGETPAGEPPFTVASHAEFLRAFAERLGLGEHDVGGICLGATVALEYASRVREQISRLVPHPPIYS